jgi:carboxymethylenebutenolidase
MTLAIDYYFAPHSPWAYLGHQRFWDIARAAGASITLLPADLGRVFPATGGLPVGKRAPQRQAYRLVELRRFSEWLHAPLNLQPRYFPVAPDEAARLIISVQAEDGVDAAMKLSGAILRSVWVAEANIADEAVLARLLVDCGLPARRLDDSHSQTAHQVYDANTARAIAAGVFGAPSYVIGGEIFWGQDRLEFVERRLAAGGGASA